MGPLVRGRVLTSSRESAERRLDLAMSIKDNCIKRLTYDMELQDEVMTRALTAEKSDEDGEYWLLKLDSRYAHATHLHDSHTDSHGAPSLMCHSWIIEMRKSSEAP